MEKHREQAIQLEEQFRETMDELYPVEICGMTYNASRILIKVDPIAYRELLLNYADSVCRDGEYSEDVYNYL